MLNSTTTKLNGFLSTNFMRNKSFNNNNNKNKSLLNIKNGIIKSELTLFSYKIISLNIKNDIFQI